MLPTRPSSRSLLDRPQRLGVLPTMWFWNDHEHQRLVGPLLAAVLVPLGPLLLWLQIVLDGGVWWQLVPSFAISFLVMGLVERHVRRQLARRAADPTRIEALPTLPPVSTGAVMLPMFGGLLLGIALASWAGIHGSAFLFAPALGAVAGLALVPLRRRPPAALPPAPPPDADSH